jgi:hypothetical protein
MRSLLPRVLVLWDGKKPCSWCVADSRLGLDFASWWGSKEVVRENHRPGRNPVGQPFYLPDVLMMIVWGP